MKLNKLQGLNEINRYNLYTSAPIQGAPAPGFSSGEAIKAIQEVAGDNKLLQEETDEPLSETLEHKGHAAIATHHAPAEANGHSPSANGHAVSSHEAPANGCQASAKGDRESASGHDAPAESAERLEPEATEVG